MLDFGIFAFFLEIVVVDFLELLPGGDLVKTDFRLEMPEKGGNPNILATPSTSQKTGEWPPRFLKVPSLAVSSFLTEGRDN